MYFEDGTRELLRQFAGRNVTWKEKANNFIFEACPFDVIIAMDEIEKKFQITCQVAIYEFFDLIPIDYTELMERSDREFGWNWDCYEGWDAAWIDFIIGHKYDSETGKIVFTIRYETGPCPVFEECHGCYEVDGAYKCDNCDAL